MVDMIFLVSVLVIFWAIVSVTVLEIVSAIVSVIVLEMVSETVSGIDPIFAILIVPASSSFCRPS